MASHCGIPPPRRKSCAACTKAKRRCDYALPACLRCSDRGIECHYPQRTRSSILRVAPSATPAPTAEEALPAPPTPCGMFSAGAFMDEIVAADTTFSQGVSYTKDIEDIFSPIDVLWDGGQQETIPGPDLEDRNTTSGVPMDSGDSQLGGPSDHAIQRPAFSSDEIQMTPGVAAERLRDAATIMNKIPRLLVETLGTPWCHADVFKRHMPTCIKDLISSAALYIAGTQESRPFALRTVTSNLTELAKSPLPSTHRESLAKTHALGVYYTMALFDGDVESRAAAEKTLPNLELACNSLLPHITYDDLSPDTSPTTLPLHPLLETESYWHNWILQESTRRTWLFTNQLLLSYSFLTNRRLAPPRETCRSWSLSGRLWSARNAVDFAVAWGAGRRLVATIGRLGEVFEQARAEDLDEFGRMLLICYLGEQEARGWIAVRGGDVSWAGLSGCLS